MAETTRRGLAKKKTEPVILPPHRADDPTIDGTEGKFRVLRLLGRGTMASVYLAEQTAMARLVALKILSQDLARDPEFVDRFLREARASARLNHPNIVAAFDFGEFQHRFFLAMEYIDGESLANLLARDGALEERGVVRIGLQVIAALRHANDHGVIHLDVKPANIMMCRDGGVKLADFGLAVVLDHPGAAEASRKAVGTPYYMAPEQVEGGRLDWRTDQFSLGASLYEAATGRKPFDGKSVPDILVKRFFEKPEPAWRTGRKVGKGFSAVLAKMLSRSPDGRYRSFADMEADFTRVLNGAKPLVASQEAAAPASPSGAGRSLSAYGEAVNRVNGMLRAKRLNWIIYSSLLFLAMLAAYAAVYGSRLVGPMPAAEVKYDLVAAAEHPPQDISAPARVLWLRACEQMLLAERERAPADLRRAMRLFRQLADDPNLGATAYATAARLRAAQLEEELNVMREGK